MIQIKPSAISYRALVSLLVWLTFCLTGLPEAYAQRLDLSRRSSCNTPSGNLAYGTYSHFYETTLEDSRNMILAVRDELLEADAINEAMFNNINLALDIQTLLSKPSSDEVMLIAMDIGRSQCSNKGSCPFAILNDDVAYGALRSSLEFLIETKDRATRSWSTVIGPAVDISEVIKNGIFQRGYKNNTKDLEAYNIASNILNNFYYLCQNPTETNQRVGIVDAYTGPTSQYPLWAAQRLTSLPSQAEWVNTPLLYSLVADIQTKIPQLITSVQNRMQRPSQPSISSVSPGAIYANGQTSTITIRGAGFGNSAYLELSDKTPACNPCRSNPDRLRRVNSNEMRYEFNPGRDPATWSLVVKDGSYASRTVHFRTYTAPDVRPPPKPLATRVRSRLASLFGGIPGLAEDESIRSTAGVLWSNSNQFLIVWDHPEDESDIARYWYKVGLPPNSPSDGTSVNAMEERTLVVNAPVTTEPYVHIWLEDNAGNKDHNNRETIRLNLDQSPPRVAILTPTSAETYSTANATVSLTGSVSDPGSGVNRMYWMMADGSTGTVTWNALQGTWTASGVPLASGPNAIGIVAEDAARNRGYAILGIQRTSTGGTTSFTLTTSGTGGTIIRSPNQANFAAGTQVSLTAMPNSGYTFKRWEGNASGSSNPVMVTMDRDRTVTAVFDRGLQSGSLQVTILPAEAVAAGARWSINGSGSYQSGQTVPIAFGGVNSIANLDISFSQVSGWATPAGIRVNLPYPESRSVVSGPYVKSTVATNGVINSTASGQQTHFGQDMFAISGRIAIAGEQFRVFRQGSGTSWVEQIPNFNRQPDGGTRDVGMDDQGWSLFVGQPWLRSTSGGRVYVFHEFGSEWIWTSTITPSTGAVDGFGYSTSVNGSSAAIGSPFESSGDGAAYVFSMNSNSEWSQSQRLINPDPSIFRNFGYNVGIWQNHMIVSSNKSDFSEGYIHIYKLLEQSWVPQSILSAGNHNPNSLFAIRGNGSETAFIRNNTIAVGAQGCAASGLDRAGCVYIFALDSNGDWILSHILNAPAPTAFERFGASVQISHGYIAIGALATKSNNISRGSVYVFRKSGDDWVLNQHHINEDTIRDDLHGDAVTLNENTVFVSAHQFQAANGTQGAVWHYPLQITNSAPIAAVLSRPSNGSAVSLEIDGDKMLDIEWSTSSDPEGENVRYQWSLARSASSFAAPIISSTLTASTSYAVSYRDLAAALERAGISVGQTASLYHRVDATDGTSLTQGAPSLLTITRGTFTSAETELATELVFHTPYPNPTREAITFRLDLPFSTDVTVRVLDLLGREVSARRVSAMEAGRMRSIEMDVSQLPAGMYVGILEVGGEIASGTRMTRFAIAR